MTARRRAAEREERESAGETVGGATGGVAGVLAGVGLGSLAGPVGAIVGGIGGAVGGWWAGEKAAEAIDDWNEEDERFYREHHEQSGEGGLPYEEAMPGYLVGHIAGRNPAYRGRTFEQIEPDLRHGFSGYPRAYGELRPCLRAGYGRTRRGI